MPISLYLVLLEVYFNWPLESLKSDKKWESYGQNTKTGRNWKGRTGCTGTPLMCTDTHWPKMTRNQSVPVHVQSVPVHFTEKCPKCVFSPIFHAPSSMDHSYTSYTHQKHSNIILIWVMTHTQTKHQDLLGFVLNPNSISFHFTMNPTTKGGFHTYFVLCGFYQP